MTDDGMPTRSDGAYTSKPDPRKSTLEGKNMSDVTLNAIAESFKIHGIISSTDVKYLIDELQLARRVMTAPDVLRAPRKHRTPDLPPAEPDPIEARLDALEQFAADVVLDHPKLKTDFINAFGLQAAADRGMLDG